MINLSCCSHTARTTVGHIAAAPRAAVQEHTTPKRGCNNPVVASWHDLCDLYRLCRLSLSCKASLLTPLTKVVSMQSIPNTLNIAARPTMYVPHTHFQRCPSSRKARREGGGDVRDAVDMLAGWRGVEGKENRVLQEIVNLVGVAS